MSAPDGSADLAATGQGRLLSRKEAVEDAALTLFAERGYHQTTMRDIGRHLNLQGPSLYNHIESKHQILVDLVTDFMLLGLNAQQRVLESTDDPIVQLSELVDIHVGYNLADPRQSYVATRELANLEEPARTHVVELRQEYERNLRDVIERGVAAGFFSVHSSRLAAYAILALGIHTSAWFSAQGSISPQVVCAEYRRYALRLVGAEAGSA